MIFADLVGHERAKELLRGAVARSAVRPGYLFAGPPGVGKHRAAAEFVRAVLCLEARGEACGTCASCALAGGGAHPDLLEVSPEEKKKSISIEQVRALGAWLAQSPALGRRKAAILDPAEALRAEGANALLKTLEEPPPGRTLILIATRPGALPPTVRSRCQQVSFGALADDEVAEVLRRNGWPAQAARQAATLAEGSPGSALECDGRAWQEAVDAVRALLDALGEGRRGAALAFAEGAGEARERVLMSLRAIIGFSRLAARQRLAGRAADAAAVPAFLERMETERLGRLLEQALASHRRLEGDRPPNAKLALATLLAAACAPPAGGTETGGGGRSMARERRA